jgi:flagellar basal-body rod modification protein FlgD
MTSITNQYLDALKTSSSTEPKVDEPNNGTLTQEDFFALLSQQLSMQDPSNPVDNDQMISQMASFSQIDALDNLNTEIQNLNALTTSNQALQASSLVGQTVLIPSSRSVMETDGQPLKGVALVGDGAQSLKIDVKDQAGQLIHSFPVEVGEGGNVNFVWDGTKADGTLAPAGTYEFVAQTKVDGKTQEVAVSTYAHVSSVTMGGSDYTTMLNIKGLGVIELADVLAVAEG